MRKLLFIALCMVFILSACSQSANTEQTGDVQAAESADEAPVFEEEELEPDFSGYPIQIYSDSVSPDSINWLLLEAKEAGFTIRINDDNTFFEGSSLVQYANEKKDGDLIFGMDELQWTALICGEYGNLSIADRTPSWADEVGDYNLDGKAFGTILHSNVMLYRNDEEGSNGEALRFEHWADALDSGYRWNLPDPEDENTLFSLNAAILFPYVDPNSPAGGISAEGWKTLWKYYADGILADNSEETDPLSPDGVQIAFCSSSLLCDRYAVPKNPGHPLPDVVLPENWSFAEIEDGSFNSPEYMGILNRAGRTADETAAVYSFAEWFGSAEVQADWAEYFGGYPCNRVSSELLYGNEIPELYTPHDFSLDNVYPDQTYSAYAIAHSAEWNSILENLGFFQTGADHGVTQEPDWENIDWAEIT